MFRLKKTFGFVFVLFVLFIAPVKAQNYKLTGVVMDATDKRTLPYAYVILLDPKDTTQKKFTTTSEKGVFILSDLKKQAYIMRVSFIGYQLYQQNITIKSKLDNAGDILLTPAARDIQTVTIVGQKAPAVQRGDTTDYNADAFKVNKDASTEDLVKKMPGVTIESGTVTAKGEQVRQVLVDGKPLFGDDPTIALRNLPAEVVDKIQVYDRMSDQSELSGFDDGQRSRTMNIVTRNNRRNGQFGKLSAGYGNEDRYIVTGTLNFFNGSRRIALLGLSNNINQQNFSMQDILGVMGTGGSMRGGSFMMRGGGGFGGRGGGYAGGMRGGAASNFFVGQQNGVATTNAFGINYADQWGSKISVTGSYFFNKSHTLAIQDINRQYVLTADSSQYYTEHSNNTSTNFNHRINMRLEYTIDSANALIFIPSLSFQANRSLNALLGVNSLSNTELLSESDNSSRTNSQGYNISNRLIFRHRFNKPGRTISIELSGGLTQRDPTSYLLSHNTYYGAFASHDTTDQRTLTTNDGYNLGSNLVYTEPLSSTGQIMLSLNNSYAKSLSDKIADAYDYHLLSYNLMDTTMSNRYNFGYLTTRVGSAYRYRKNNLSLTFGLEFQNASLAGNQVFPTAYDVGKNFNNVLPNAMMQYKISARTNVQFNYRTSTNPPSISQLQNVIDNSNPLLLSTGNPNLRPEYSHSLMARYSYTNPDKLTTFFAFISGSNTLNNIGNATIIAQTDTTFSVEGNLVHLNPGSQLTRPMNFGKDWNFRSFLVFGFPIRPIRCNLNFNTGFTYTQAPGYVNQLLNLANTYSISQGVVVASNISEKVDFTIYYNINYNLVENSVRPDLNDHYVIQSLSFRSNINWKGFVFSNDISGNSYKGLSASYNQQILLWNLSLGKKFLKNQNGELRLTVFDLLKQNKSIVRNVTETYIEDQRTNTMGQYFMVTFTYNLRRFNTKG